MHPLNISVLIDVKLLFISIDAELLHPSNNFPSIAVIFEGIIIDCKFVQ